MIKSLIGLVALAAAASVSASASAQDDDWEFQEDATQKLSVAAVRYDAGQAIVVQCRDGALTAVLVGLPQSAQALQVNATRADGRGVSQAFVSGGAPGAWRMATPGRDVRFLRGGGLYSIQTPAGATPVVRAAFDLPTQSANIDRVLTACGWAVEDERDQLADAEVSLTDPAAAPSDRRYTPTRRGATSRAPRQEIAAEDLPHPAIPNENQVSCIVRDLHLRDCRADHPASARNRDILAIIRAFEGDRVYPLNGTDAAANEGKVLRTVNRLITVVDYVATVPAGR